MASIIAIILLLSSLPLISLADLPEKVRFHNSSTLPKSAYPLGRNSTFIRTASNPETSSVTWESVIDSTHFSVYYNTTGPNSTTDEYAQTVISALEYSWTTEVTNFGFRAPPDSHMNVYLEDLPDEPTDEFGVTNQYWSSVTGWHVENITIDIGKNMGLVRVTSAHEFFHAIQLSYYPNDRNAPEGAWIEEGTATWISSKVYPEYVGYGSYVDAVNFYMSSPDRAITQLDYDAVLYWIFLDEHYDGIATIEDVLQQTTSKDGIYAVNATLNTKGTTFREVFKEWTIANYLKNFFYSNGKEFDPITSNMPHFIYDGEERPFYDYVSDWGADYFEVSSEVIYMPILFEGEQPHNLTKILIEHNMPLITDFPLNSTYVGFFPLMQANNLDKIVIIVRSLGNETSTKRVDYTLSLLTSSYTLEGPYQLTSSTTTTTIIETTATHLSSTLTLAIVNKSSSQSSPTSTITTVNGSSTQTSSPKTTTVVNKSSSQSSSETAPINVRIKGDIDADGDVDFDDFIIFAGDYGTEVGEALYDPRSDLDDDGRISFDDFIIFAANYGKTV